MTFRNDGKNWFFSITVSLILHLPLALLLVVARPQKPLVEPSLTVVLHIVPTMPKVIPPRQIASEPTGSQSRILPQKKDIGKISVTQVKPAGKPTSDQEDSRVENSAVGETTLPAASGLGVAGEAPKAVLPQPGNTGSAALISVESLRITKKVVPDYPTFSCRRKEEGTVKILITIKDGAVVKAEICESSNYERLDNSALRAMKQWRFNQKEEIRAIVPIVFSLTD